MLTLSLLLSGGSLRGSNATSRSLRRTGIGIIAGMQAGLDVRADLSPLMAKSLGCTVGHVDLGQLDRTIVHELINEVENEGILPRVSKHS